MIGASGARAAAVARADGDGSTTAAILADRDAEPPLLRLPGSRKERAHAIVDAVAHYDDADYLAEVSMGLGEAMPSLDVRTMPESELMATRGW